MMGVTLNPKPRLILNRFGKWIEEAPPDPGIKPGGIRERALQAMARRRQPVIGLTADLGAIEQPASKK
jgi:hypothetical protein